MYLLFFCLYILLIAYIFSFVVPFKAIFTIDIERKLAQVSKDVAQCK